jgi:hypothetical protein
MILGVTISKDTRQLVGRLGLGMMLVGLLPSSGFAEVINLKDKVIPAGVLAGEDGKMIPIQVPKESTQSIEKNKKVDPPAGKTEAQLLEKIDALQKRVERLERLLEEIRKADGTPTPAPGFGVKPEEGLKAGSLSGSPASKSTAIHEQLLREELGQVEGVILWQGKPLANGNVRIELEKYTGFSMSSVKKMFSEDERGSVDQGLSLSAKTDSQGRYSFAGVPPGSYRIYWWPDFKTGWVHRLREKPDFEVISGKVTVQNIPENPTIMKKK